jgi:hypothetical protein
MTDAEVIAYYRAGTLFRELHRPADTNQQERCMPGWRRCTIRKASISSLWPQRLNFKASNRPT